MISVTIENMKSIVSLNFTIPESGAFVITGANGCGKTSLLVALHRMGARNAFQTGLPSAQGVSGIDGLGEARIAYSIHGKEVSYRYNQQRWSATPKANSTLVLRAFAEVKFLKADESRVKFLEIAISGQKKVAAAPELVSFLNTVFDTDKFNKLRRVRLRGRDVIAHLIEVQDGSKKSYYSEKAFSLGELCVIRLAQKLLSARRGSLYVIDEFELAVHPAAQVRMFKLMENIALERECTILVSTHSSTLIRSINRGRIIYLDNQDGVVEVHRDVYPTFALQFIAPEDDSYPDKIIFVEDREAKLCVEALIRHQRVDGSMHTLPNVKVIPIGGYREVIEFLENSKGFLPSTTKRIAALDADAQEQCIPLRSGSENKLHLLYTKHRSQILFLPWTPEHGLCELLRSNIRVHLPAIQHQTGIIDLRITLADVSAHTDLQGNALRVECKRSVAKIAEKIASKKGWSVERAEEELYTYLVSQLEEGERRGIIGRLTC